MFRKLSAVTSGKNGVMIPQEALKNCCDATITECKYTIVGTVANLVNIKVKNAAGTTVTLTMPASATTAALKKAWFEQAVRDMDGYYIAATDYDSTEAFGESLFETSLITIWGQLVVVSANFGASDVNSTAYCTRAIINCYEVDLGATDNNFNVSINGTAYEVISGQVIPGTTTTTAIDNAITTAIAAAVATIPTVVVTFNDLTSKYHITFTATAKETEIIVNGVQATYCGTTQTFIA